MQSAARDALLEAGVTPYNGLTFDHVVGTKVGGSLFDSNGRRHTAADLLTYANPNNIDLYIFATVQQILFATSPTSKLASPLAQKSRIGITTNPLLKQHKNHQQPIEMLFQSSGLCKQHYAIIMCCFSEVALNN